MTQADPELGLPAVKAGTAEKTTRVQKQVDEVSKIMEKNVADAMARGEQLDDLAQKTAALEAGSKAFSKNAGKARANLWLKNMKYWAMLAGLVVLLLLLIFHKEVLAALFSVVTG
jgi:hypothetical protein